MQKRGLLAVAFGVLAFFGACANGAETGAKKEAVVDYADAAQVRPVNEEQRKQIAAFLKQRNAEWETFRGFQADVRIEWLTGEGGKPQALEGKLTLRVKKQNSGREPYRYPYVFAHPSGEWKMDGDGQMNGAGRASPRYETKDEETKTNLQQLTGDGQLFSLPILSHYLYASMDSHFSELGQADGKSSLLLPATTGSVAAWNPKAGEFALYEHQSDTDKCFVFRGGQFFRMRFQMDGGQKVDKDFRFQRYVALPGGPSIPSEITLRFGGEPTIRMTLTNLAPVEPMAAAGQ